MLERLITDNDLVAFDIFYYMRKKTTSQKGYVGIKLDMTKAYDILEWDFLLEVLMAMGFPPNWTDLISRCISIASFSVSLMESYVNSLNDLGA